MAVRRVGKAWGNALGGYKRQNRSRGGQFSSGFAGSVSSNSISALSAGQRRAQYLDRQRKKSSRKATAKKAAKIAGVAIAAGAVGYAGYRSVNGVKSTQYVNDVIGSGFTKKVKSPGGSTRTFTVGGRANQIYNGSSNLSGTRAVSSAGSHSDIRGKLATAAAVSSSATAINRNLQENLRISAKPANQSGVREHSSPIGDRTLMRSPDANLTQRALTSGRAQYALPATTESHQQYGNLADHYSINHDSGWSPAVKYKPSSAGQLNYPGMNRPGQKKRNVNGMKIKDRPTDSGQKTAYVFEDIERYTPGSQVMRGEASPDYFNDDRHEAVALGWTGRARNSSAGITRSLGGTEMSPKPLPQQTAAKATKNVNLGAADTSRRKAPRERPVSDFEASMNQFHPGLRDLEQMELENMTAQIQREQAAVRRAAMDPNRQSKARSIENQKTVSGMRVANLSQEDRDMLPRSQQAYLSEYNQLIAAGEEPTKLQVKTATTIYNKANKSYAHSVPSATDNEELQELRKKEYIAQNGGKKMSKAEDRRLRHLRQKVSKNNARSRKTAAGKEYEQILISEGLGAINSGSWMSDTERAGTGTNSNSRAFGTSEEDLELMLYGQKIQSKKDWTAGD